MAINSLLFLSMIFTTSAYAGNACVQVCQQKNRQDVSKCNYPQKEPPAHRQCLATVKNNFDACMQACGK